MSTNSNYSAVKPKPAAAKADLEVLQQQENIKAAADWHMQQVQHDEEMKRLSNSYEQKLTVLETQLREVTYERKLLMRMLDRISAMLPEPEKLQQPVEVSCSPTDAETFIELYNRSQQGGY